MINEPPIDRIIRFSRFSDMVYEPLNKLKSFLDSDEYLIFIDWIEDKKTSTQCCVASYGSSLVFCFRGLTPGNGIQELLKDIETSSDFKLSTRKLPTGESFKAHCGFLDAYESIQQFINDIVLKHGSFRVFTIGHSLGGALAQISALDISASFSNQKKILVRCYNFACPRTGNSDFVNLSNKYVRTCRIVNIGDPIPCLPSKIFGYDHIGHEYIIGNSVCLWKRISQHKMSSYIKELEKIKLSKPTLFDKLGNIISQFKKRK